MDKLDILNRSEFVERLINLVQNISTNKASTCFAINGSWGCGKSFVLDLFQERLEQIQFEETHNDKYFVVRYNSWKYDYYEEPLVAIVSTMIETIEEKTKLFPDSKEKQEILGMLKATGVALLSIANDAVKEKTGLDFQKAYGIVKSGEKEGAANYESEHAYDVYFGFNKMITKLTKLLEEISRNYTIVLIVDELDRCMPEYAVKVLERLHHLTENQPNTITVIAFDKLQLITSVKQLFGFDVPEKYLEKFINFEVELDCGTVSERITEKYCEYIELFDPGVLPFEESVEECVQAIFKNIDIRTQERLVKKAMLAHKLLYKEKKDYSFMCMELLVTVMIDVHNYSHFFTEHPLKAGSFDSIFKPYSNSPEPDFSKFFGEKLSDIYFKKTQYFQDDPIVYTLPSSANLYAAIMFTWYWMHKKNPKVIFQYEQGSIYKAIDKNPDELKKYADTLRIIK